ncbi:unnamed protein product, partial [Mesorhabditis spiculigera]
MPMPPRPQPQPMPVPPRPQPQPQPMPPQPMPQPQPFPRPTPGRDQPSCPNHLECRNIDVNFHRFQSRDPCTFTSTRFNDCTACCRKNFPRQFWGSMRSSFTQQRGQSACTCCSTSFCRG